MGELVISTKRTKEGANGYLAGPHNSLPFDFYRVRPIGVATGKYSDKKRLIIDLSLLHNSIPPHWIESGGILSLPGTSHGRGTLQYVR